MGRRHSNRLYTFVELPECNTCVCISSLHIILKGNSIKLTGLTKLTEINLKRVHVVALESNSATNIITEMIHAIWNLYDISLYPQMFSFCGSHRCKIGHGITMWSQYGRPVFTARYGASNHCPTSCSQTACSSIKKQLNILGQNL